MTAENVQVKPFAYPKPPTLKDVLNPRAGHTVYESSNRYQQESLLGSKPVHQSDSDMIVLDSSSTYRKHSQRKGPLSPDHWIQQEQRSSGSKTSVERGMARWTALPELIEVLNARLSLVTWRWRLVAYNVYSFRLLFEEVFRQ